jgi:hypothetical protein
MFYYLVGFQGCALTAASLVESYGSGDPNNVYNFSSGQCGSWANLLESALAINGIPSRWTNIVATDKSLMVIKNWTLSPSPTFVNQSPWAYQLFLNSGDPMVPARTSYGDLTNISGLPGQGLATPDEKVFGSHFIVQVPLLLGYYDPSYGVSYPDAVGFENQAVAGYAVQFPGDPPGTYHFRPADSTHPNITLTCFSAKSMVQCN